MGDGLMDGLLGVVAQHLGPQAQTVFHELRSRLAKCHIAHCRKHSPGVVCSLCSGHTCLRHVVLLPKIPSIRAEASLDEKVPVSMACLECVVLRYEDEKEAPPEKVRGGRR